MSEHGHKPEWEERAATLREKLADHSKLTGGDDPLRIMALEIGLSIIEQRIDEVQADHA